MALSMKTLHPCTSLQPYNWARSSVPCALRMDDPAIPARMSEDIIRFIVCSCISNLAWVWMYPDNDDRRCYRAIHRKASATSKGSEMVQQIPSSKWVLDPCAPCLLTSIRRRLQDGAAWAPGPPALLQQSSPACWLAAPSNGVVYGRPGGAVISAAVMQRQGHAYRRQVIHAFHIYLF